MNSTVSSHQEASGGGRSSASRRARGLASAFLVMGLFVVAGCGVGSKKVAGSATTVAASTTAAATSTTSADTSADTSSDTTDTSTDTTTDTGSQTVGQTWPKVAQDAFVRSCSASAAADVCKCALRALEPVLSFNDLESIGSGASNVSKFQAQIRKATLECVADPHSH
ncbi:MAG TPA: hypothetical protein VID05_10715 [Acidimicrobiales bacterium]